MPEEHSTKIGGSSAARVIACPGSLPRSAKIPDSTSEYAREGSALHVCMELLLTEQETLGSLPGVCIEVDGVDVEITQEHVEDRLQPAMDLFDEFLDEIEKRTDAVAEFELEQKVGFTGNLDGCWGTADVIGRCGPVAFVLDWKFGQGVGVKAENNIQLQFYAGAALETSTTADLFDGATDVCLAIVQPSCREVKPLQMAWITPGVLSELRDDLVKALALTELGDEAPLDTGPHCKWCPVKPMCPKHFNLAADAVEKGLPDDAWDPAELAESLELADEVEGWAKAVREFAHERLEDGREVPGWKLVLKRASRRWADTTALEDWARENRMLKVFFPRKPIGIGEADKVVKRKKLDLPDRLIVSSSTGTTIARADDKRPGVTNAIEDLARIAKNAGLV